MAESAERNIPAYDVFVKYRWVFLIIGFSHISGIGYLLYRTFLFILNAYVQCMVLYATYLVAPDKKLIIEAIHVSASGVFAITVLTGRMFTDRSLKNMRNMVNSGIYNYEEEELDEEQIQMRSSVAEEVKRKTMGINVMYSLGFLSNMIFFPLSQYLISSGVDISKYKNNMNPYLPHMYYIPFDSHTVEGYMSAYLIDFLFWLCMYTLAICSNAMYMTSIVHLKVHMDVLNHSIRNIESRAYTMYNKISSAAVATLTMDDLRENVAFRKCLYSCFRANVRHHQALIKFRNECQPLVGYIVLAAFSVASLIYATKLYLMSQKPPTNVMVNCLFTSLAEQTYCLYLGITGEEIIEKGNKLYETLYNIPWFNHDKRLNRAICIMMCNTRKPITLKAMLVNVEPSLEVYGDILTAMYKLMSLARQSDALN